MQAPKLDLEILDNQKAILVVQCQECGDKSRFLLEEVTPGTAVLCNCGGVLNLADESVRAVRQKAENLMQEKP